MDEELRHILDLMVYGQADLAVAENAIKVMWHADDKLPYDIARNGIEKCMKKLQEALESFPNAE